jgi:hypothetical protein
LPIRLTSQKDAAQILIVTDSAWYALLDLAEEYGWNPYGPMLPGQWDSLEFDLSGYTPGEELFSYPEESGTRRHLVVLDDAVNLAEALERAFMDYEPQRVPASFYLFTPEIQESAVGLGVLRAVIELGTQGAFWLEEYNSK